MGITFQHAAVHEGAGVAFVGIAHHKAGTWRLEGNGVPLQAGGIARPAPAPQATAADLSAHFSGG